MTIKILFTKRIPNHFVKSLSSKRFLIDMLDFITIKYMSLEKKPTLNKVLIFTSKNAVRGFLQSFPEKALREKKIFTVGNQTASLIEEIGVQVMIKKHYAQDFSPKKDRLPQGPYDWFCGTRSLKHLVDSLKKYSLNRYEVYDTILRPCSLSKGYDALVFFSPSAVASFLEKNNISQNVHCFAIGKTTSKALLLSGVSKVSFPKNPSTVSLINLIKRYFSC